MASTTKRRASALAERVAVERRQRAIMAMLRDEQAEQTDTLDRRFRALRERGLIVPELGKRAKIEDADDGTNLSSSFAYDTMYRDLQLQPPPSIANKAENVSLPAERRKEEVPDFGVAFEQFMECADKCGASREGIGQLDIQLRTRLLPSLKKCSIAGPQRILERLGEMHSNFKRSKKSNTSAPSFSQITLLRLINALFLEHCHFHPLAGPAFAFAMELISGTRIRSVRQCARLIFLCSQLSEWIDSTENSTRPPHYLPEVMAFLRGALQLCCQSETDAEGRDEPFPTMAFPISQPHRQMLFIAEKKVENLSRERLELSRIFDAHQMEVQTADEHCDKPDKSGNESERDEEEFRLLTIRALFDTIRAYARLYGDHPNGGAMKSAFNPIFGPIYCLCQRLPLCNYPTDLAAEGTELTQLLAKLMEQNSRVTHLKRSAKKRKRSIQMLEPRFDERFNPERPSAAASATQKNGQKMREKRWEKRARKERRGALKVLRKDARELASACAERQRKVRRERDEKTKRIMQFLEVQESEHKKLKVMKR